MNLEAALDEYREADERRKQSLAELQTASAHRRRALNELRQLLRQVGLPDAEPVYGMRETEQVH